MSALVAQVLAIALGRFDQVRARRLGVEKRFDKGFRVLPGKFPLGVVGDDLLRGLSHVLDDEVGDRLAGDVASQHQLLFEFRGDARFQALGFAVQRFSSHVHDCTAICRVSLVVEIRIFAVGPQSGRKGEVQDGQSGLVFAGVHGWFSL